MSARSMTRAQARENDRAERRARRRARHLATGTALALGAAAAVAPAAGAAPFTVNSTADTTAPTPCDATCTLRDAVGDANLTAAADTITFAPSVTGEIKIDDDNNPFPIDSAMTISGPGSGVLAVSGDFRSQIFYAETDVVGAPNEAVTISGLTLKEASADTGQAGAAIYAQESALTLDSDVVRGNFTDSQGAVYANGSSLTVTNSTFTGNVAGSGGGAIYTDDDAGVGGDNVLTVRNSTFRGNSAGYNGGAIYVDDETGSALIVNSTFQGNSAGVQGGAIRFYGPETGSATVVDSTISGNTAGAVGGAISSYGQYDRPVEVLNSTVTGNFAGDSGGGFYRYGNDLPANAGADAFSVSSSIVATNEAPLGPDLVNRVFQTGDDPVTGAFAVGFSLIGNTAGAPITETPVGSNQLNVDPQLGVIADNGGPTRTVLPAPTSPAIDAGTANGLTTDQRGLPRTVKTSFSPAAGSDGTDIGAVELQDAGLEGAAISAKKKQPQKGKKVVVTVDVSANEAVKADVRGKVKVGKKSVKLKGVSGKLIKVGKSVTIKLSPKSKKGSRTILKTLASGKKAKASLSVKLTDAAGNSTSKKPKVTLK